MENQKVTDLMNRHFPNSSINMPIWEGVRKMMDEAYHEGVKTADCLQVEGLPKIFEALLHAKEKHPTWPMDINKQFLILSEEIGEVAKAILQWQDEGGSFDSIPEELYQSGAMILRIIEHLEFTKNNTEIY